MSRIVRKGTDSDGVEVNIMYVFGLLLRRLWLLILVALVVGASCAVVTKAVEEPTYTSSMTFIVNNKSEKDLSSSGENSVSYNDMSASAYMANTFVHLMTGRTMCDSRRVQVVPENRGSGCEDDSRVPQDGQQHYRYDRHCFLARGGL